MEPRIFRAANGRDLVYSFSEGEGHPILFLNGLGDSFECWSSVLTSFKQKRPCLLVDLPGQGYSLERDFDSDRQWNYQLSVEEQVSSLLELLDELEIKKFGVVGFSYGGGISLALTQRVSERITDLILLLPFILRLDLSFPMSRLWVAQFDFLKSLTPQSLRQPFDIVERSYERFLRHYMNFRYFGRIPNEKKRQVAVEISRGIMEFNSFDIISSLPEEKLVLVTSGLDTLVPQSLYSEFWYRIPKAKKKAWVKVINGEHLLLEQSPQFVGEILTQAFSGSLEGEYKLNLQ